MLSLVIGMAGVLSAQWQPDVRLTNNPRYDATCGNNAWAVAADNLGNVFVVWYAKIGTYYQILFRQYTGGAWGTELQLTTTSTNKIQPSIAVDRSDNLYLAWSDQGTIKCKRFYGGRWLAEEQVSASQNYGEVHPAIAVDSAGDIIVVYESHRSSAAQIFCRVKLGTAWQLENRVSTNAFNNFNPTLALDGAGNYHVAWEGNNQIFYRKCAASTWQAQQQLTTGSHLFNTPSIGSDGTNVHVVFMQDSSNVQYMKLSSGTWSTPVTISGGSKNYYPSIACEPSGTCDVVYRSLRTSPSQIWYCTNPGGTWQADTQLTNASSDRYQPTITYGSPSLNVVWQDYRDGNPEIYYKQHLVSVDAKVVSIDEPSGDVAVNSTIQPKATVQNNGGATISFNVKCLIGAYTSTKTVTNLAQGATQQVIFDNWTPQAAGSDTITVITMLPHDAVPSNDTLSRVFNVVGVAENRPALPAGFALGAVRPNPVATSARISYALPVDARLTLAVYDITGKLVRTLVAGERTAGYHTVVWNGKDNDGAPVPTGLYFIRLETDRYSTMDKLVLTR